MGLHTAPVIVSPADAVATEMDGINMPRDGRSRNGLTAHRPCPECGFDLRGSADSERCPECGLPCGCHVRAFRTARLRALRAPLALVVLFAVHLVIAFGVSEFPPRERDLAGQCMGAFLLILAVWWLRARAASLPRVVLVTPGEVIWREHRRERFRIRITELGGAEYLWFSGEVALLDEHGCHIVTIPHLGRDAHRLADCIGGIVAKKSRGAESNRPERVGPTHDVESGRDSAEPRLP